MNRIVPITAVILLVVASGCQIPSINQSTMTAKNSSAESSGNSNTWELAIFFPEYDSEENGAVKLWIGVARNFDGEIYGVRIQFLNDEQEIVKEVPVGNITGWDKHWVNTTFPTMPVFVTADVAGWNTSGLRPTGIEGQKFEADGEISSYTKRLPRNETRTITDN